MGKTLVGEVIVVFIAQDAISGQVKDKGGLQQLARAQAELIEMRRERGLAVASAMEGLSRLRQRIERGAA